MSDRGSSPGRKKQKKREWESAFGLRPPAGGDDLRVVWRADLGRRLRIGDVAAHLDDLHAAVCVGERWGAELARASARQMLTNRAIRHGPGSRMFRDAGRRLGYSDRDIFMFEESINTGRRPPAPEGFPYRDPGKVLETLADTLVLDQLGRPMTVVQIQYRNPLEVVLTGSGFIVAGVMFIVRLARDWSNTRRIGAGAAREAEAGARESEARADLLRWLVDETMARRMPVPPGDLLASMTHSEAGTLQRLAAADVTLELPEGFDPSETDERPA